MTRASDARYARKKLRKLLERQGVSESQIRHLDLDRAYLKEEGENLKVGIPYSCGIENCDVCTQNASHASPPRKEEKSDMNSNPATNVRTLIRGVAIVQDPALWRRNQTEQKIRERGIEIVRTYDAGQEAPKEVQDVAVMICQGMIKHGNVPRWKGLADRSGVRFFVIRHTTSDPEWRRLEEWVARTWTETGRAGGIVTAPESSSVVNDREVNELRAAFKASRAEVERLGIELGAARVQISKLEAEAVKLRKAGEQWASDTALSNKEREELRRQVVTLSEKVAEARRERAVDSSRYGKEVEDLRSALSSAEEKLSRALAGGSGPSPFRVAAVKYAALAEEGVLSHKQAIGKILTLGKKE